MSYLVRAPRRRRGLGDCTPSSCPSGPYPGDNNANYSYWLEQASEHGAVLQPGSQTWDIDTQPIQHALDQQSPSYYAGYQDMQTAFGWELCPQNDVGAQYACSQRNTLRGKQIGDLQILYHGLVPRSALPGVPPPLGGIPAPPEQQSPPPSQQGTRAPSVSFTSSRGGNGSTVYPGDSWSIAVSGTPGAQVIAQGGKLGSIDRTPMGTLDANGSLRLAGTFDGSQAGPWAEQWFVGGAPAGSVSFVVAAPVAVIPPANPPTTGPLQLPPAQQTGYILSGNSSGGGVQIPASMESTVFGFPVWAIAAGVGALVLLRK